MTVAVCIVCGIAFIIAARWEIHSMARGPHGMLAMGSLHIIEAEIKRLRQELEKARKT